MKDDGVDSERRFGGLRRLYGDVAYVRLRQLSVAVIGLGGVGSWAVEALARSGVARLVLVDMDHVAESNVNRQIQATTATLGQAKAEALRQRIQGIHPECCVVVVDDFASVDNWPFAEVADVDVVIDACDDTDAKEVMARWALAAQRPVVICGAAGGKRAPQRVEVAPLMAVTHDPLLARLRQRLRKSGHLPAVVARGSSVGSSVVVRASGADVAACLWCVFSKEPVQMPVASSCGGVTDGSLNCQGYGSSVTVTGGFGFVAAAAAIDAGLGLAQIEKT